MATSRIHLPVSLWVLLLAATVACVSALPARPDVQLHADRSRFAVRLRAVRKSESKSEIAKSRPQTETVVSDKKDGEQIDYAIVPQGDQKNEEKTSENPADSNDATRKKTPDKLQELQQAWEVTAGKLVEKGKGGDNTEKEDLNKTDKPANGEISQADSKPSSEENQNGPTTSETIAVPLIQDPVKQDIVKDTKEGTPSGDLPQNLASDGSSPSNIQKPVASPANSETKTSDAAPIKDEQNEKKARPELTKQESVNVPAKRNKIPPEFYMTRKNHIARPQVRPNHNGQEQHGPDYIAENPLYEWTFPCSSQEKSCLDEDRVLYEGDRQCYQLWRLGPCSRGEWLVIDKTEALNGSGRFLAVCTNMSRCQGGEVYMASDHRCHTLSQIIREVCPKHQGLQLSYNVFGEGECKCDNCPAPQLPTNTFNEGRCAFPPSFYRADAGVGLEMAWRTALSGAAEGAAKKRTEVVLEESKVPVSA